MFESVMTVNANERTGKGEQFTKGGENGGVDDPHGRHKEGRGDERYAKDYRAVALPGSVGLR